jgi:hypothetical protein
LLGGDHSAHEVVGSAQACFSWALAGGVGRNDRDDAALAQRVDVAVRPVAGVGDHDPRPVFDPGAFELSLCGRDHRIELLEVDALGGDLGGDHDLLLGCHGLGVVGGHEGGSLLHPPGVGSVVLSWPSGRVGGV